MYRDNRESKTLPTVSCGSFFADLLGQSEASLERICGKEQTPTCAAADLQSLELWSSPAAIGSKFDQGSLVLACLPT